MKYSLLAAAFAFSLHSAPAQSLEKKVAARSCECLEKEKAVTESILRDCLAHALTEAVMADSTKKYVRQLSTVESVQRTMKGAYKLLARQCRAMPRPREN